ncbi:sulfurtransferase [Nocardioides aurantiacus]|uniref:Sulfurtransferase n=1 Tax=Nocardioides aurantiacus TaxID=86796 RepID=A0A3N2CVX6_9ACTN|nr:sulfurtransferase [Nocardioides aurantiacus]ROR91364.1 thiosulfate/3-mercaptopyruvate sulfurtransferase [Nocardioides aurantiacus]
MEPSSPSPLIDVSRLAERLGEVTVLDVRWRLGGPPGEQEHAAGHVPGAAYVDLDTALADPPGGRGRHPLPDPARLQEALRAAGVREDRPVVVYDDWQGRAAARCWWLLRWAGHRDTSVLDGGWGAWVAAGLEVATGPVVAEPGDVVVRPGAMPTVTADELPGVVAAGVVLDARDPGRYAGETEPVDPVAGHVPGARNVPTGANLAEDGRFLAPDALAEVYAAARERPTAVYCGSGITAAHDVLALEVAGMPGAALYPGSWSEWVTDPTRAVATGREPGGSA